MSVLEVGRRERAVQEPSRTAASQALSRSALIWIVLGWVGYAALPWYGLERGLPEELVARSGLVLGAREAWWLLPIALSLLATLRPLFGADT